MFAHHRFSKFFVGCATFAITLSFGMGLSSADPPASPAPHGGTVAGTNEDQGNTGGDDDGGIQAMGMYAGTQAAMSSEMALDALTDGVGEDYQPAPIIIPGVNDGDGDGDGNDGGIGHGQPGETLAVTQDGIDGQWSDGQEEESNRTGGPAPTWDLGPQTPVSFFLFEEKPSFRYAPELLQFVEDNTESPEQTHLGIQSGNSGRIYFAPLGEF